MYEAVIFDLDSTLTNTHRYPFVACEWLLRKAGVFSEEQMISFIRILVTRYREAIQDIVEGASYRSPFDIVKTAMGNSMHDLDIRGDYDLVEEATQRFKSLHIELSTPYSGVIEVLDSLKTKTRRLGVLSNSFEGHTKIILKKLELSRYFSSVIDCGDVQAYKPTSSLFERVVQNLNVEISKSIYVGDEYYADMVGAKVAGMTTIWINNRERSLSGLIAKHGAHSSPDYVLKSVSEMFELF